MQINFSIAFSAYKWQAIDLKRNFYFCNQLMLPHLGKSKTKNRSFPRFAFNAETSAVLFNNFGSDVQAKS